MTNAAQDKFINTAAGQFLDPDGVYNFQCVDVAIAYAIACFPGVDWHTSFGRNNANGHYPKDNQWFQSIPNVVGDLNSYPQRGDIVIWGGDKFNPYGHIAVVVSADAYSMQVLQQNADGSGRLPVQLATLGYDQPGTGGVVGWLRPKVAGAAPAPAPAPKPSAGILNGVDISNHQGNINVGATGAQFVIIKATEGVGYTDPQYVDNVRRARQAGLLVGHYHFARPVGPENSPTAEADWFLSVVRDQLGPDDVVVLDWEAEHTENTRWANDWLDLVAATSQKKPWLYANRSVANQPGWDAVKGKYPLWCAAYPTTSNQSWGPVNAAPSVPGWNLVAWQYSSAGRLPGYGGDLDLNVFYGDRSAWLKLAAGGAWTAPAVKPGPVAQPAPKGTTPAQCVVEAGDTLSGIASQFKVALADLIKVNAGINPDRIYPGQVLSLPGAPAPAKQPAAVKKCVVEAGDTLAGIAKQFGVDLSALISLNGISNPNLIFPGQVLNLPGTVPAPPAAPAKSVGHGQWIVDPGDTLGAIGAHYGVSAGAIAAANHIANPNLIFVGQVLNIP